MKLTQQKFLNPATGKMVGYVRAKTLGLISNTSFNSLPQMQTDFGSFEVETVRVKDLKFDPKVFIPIKTGSPHLDTFISSDGGFMPATNVIMIGSPGVGKSTVGMDFAARAKKHGKKVLFISGEMGRIDMYRYCKRFPKFGELDTLFLSDYAKSNPVMAIEKVLMQGYDLILVDSWAEVCRSIQDFSGLSKSQAESWFLDMMEKHNEAKNDAGLYTCFLIIQQVTKSGEFLGSNRLKHMTSAMLEMTRDREQDRCLMEFSKNRVGTAGESIAFNITRNAVNYAHA